MSIESVNLKRKAFWNAWQRSKEQTKTFNEQNKGLVGFIQAEKPEFIKKPSLTQLKKVD